MSTAERFQLEQAIDALARESRVDYNNTDITSRLRERISLILDHIQLGSPIPPPHPWIAHTLTP